MSHRDGSTDDAEQIARQAVDSTPSLQKRSIKEYSPNQHSPDSLIKRPRRHGAQTPPGAPASADDRDGWTIVRPDLDTSLTPSHPQVGDAVDEEDATQQGQDSPDETSPSVETSNNWHDPVNQQVLGPPGWMAAPPDAARERIERTLDAAHADKYEAPYPIELELRQQSIDLAIEVMRTCMQAPGAVDSHGRFILNYLIRADGESGYFEDISISNRHHFDDPTAENCMIEKLSHQRLQTQDYGEMKVNYPVFTAIFTPQ